MRRTTLVVALSAVLMSTSARSEQRSEAPGATRGQFLREEVKVQKASVSRYRLPSSLTGERCFEWRLRSHWDLCSR